LIQIAEFDFYALVAAGDGAEVAYVRVAADPNGRSLRNPPALRGGQPLIEAPGAAPNVSMRVARHFQIAACVKRRNTLLVVHGGDLQRPGPGQPTGALIGRC